MPVMHQANFNDSSKLPLHASIAYHVYNGISGYIIIIIVFGFSIQKCFQRLEKVLSQCRSWKNWSGQVLDSSRKFGGVKAIIVLLGILS